MRKKGFANAHKRPRVDSSHECLCRQADKKDNFLHLVVKGDETCTFHFTPEIKQLLNECQYSSSPNLQKFKQTQSTVNVMVAVFWNFIGRLHRSGTTINVGRYCELKKN